MEKTFKYNEVDVDEYAKLPNPLAADFAAMFDFYMYVRGNPGRDIALTKNLNPKCPHISGVGHKEQSKNLSNC